MYKIPGETRERQQDSHVANHWYPASFPPASSFTASNVPKCTACVGPAPRMIDDMPLNRAHIWYTLRQQYSRTWQHQPNWRVNTRPMMGRPSSNATVKLKANEKEVCGLSQLQGWLEGPRLTYPSLKEIWCTKGLEPCYSNKRIDLEGQEQD